MGEGCSEGKEGQESIMERGPVDKQKYLFFGDPRLSKASFHRKRGRNGGAGDKKKGGFRKKKKG